VPTARITFNLLDLASYLH